MRARGIAIVLILCVAAVAAAPRQFGKGEAVSFVFPPPRDAAAGLDETPEWLDEGWQFVQYLYDVDTTSSVYQNYLNAFPVGLELTHAGRGFLAVLHTVFRTTDGGMSWRNMDVNPPPPISRPSDFTSLRLIDDRNPAFTVFISDLKARPVARDTAYADTLLLSVTYSEADSGWLRVIRYQAGHRLWGFPQLRVDAWLTHVAIPDSLTGYAFSGLDGRVYHNDSLWNSTSWNYLNPDKAFVRSGRRDTLSPVETWVGDAAALQNFVIAVGSHHWISRNGGRLWRIFPAADSLFDNAVSFCDTVHGMTCGGMVSPQTRGWIHVTDDGGRTWSGRVLETNVPVRAIEMLSPELAFAGGGMRAFGLGRLWMTTDGGQTWTEDATLNAEITELAVNRVTTAQVDVIAAGVFRDYRGGVWRKRVDLPQADRAVVIADPDTLNFGGRPAGTRDTLTVTLRNTGSRTDSITGVTGAGAFSAVWTPGVYPLEPEAQMPLRIVFQADSLAQYRGTVRVFTRQTGTVEIYCMGEISSAADPRLPILPERLALSIAPNPANAVFRIRFDLPRAGRAQLQVFDVQGRLVRTLADATYSAGEQHALWDATPFASGLYFVRLQAAGESRMQKALLLK